MTALPKDFLPTAAPKPQPRSRRRQGRILPIHAVPTVREQATETSAAPPVGLHIQALPTALQVLSQLQRTTSVLALGLVTVTLGVYGWTVYTPMQWSREYTKLKTLQQMERQLLANTESLKNQLARQAEQPSSGLVTVSPQQNIFLPTSVVSQKSAPQQSSAAATTVPLPGLSAHQPLAY